MSKWWGEQKEAFRVIFWILIVEISLALILSLIFGLGIMGILVISLLLVGITAKFSIGSSDGLKGYVLNNRFTRKKRTVRESYFLMIPFVEHIVLDVEINLFQTEQTESGKFSAKAENRSGSGDRDSDDAGEELEIVYQRIIWPDVNNLDAFIAVGKGGGDIEAIQSIVGSQASSFIEQFTIRHDPDYVRNNFTELAEFVMRKFEEPVSDPRNPGVLVPRHSLLGILRPHIVIKNVNPSEEVRRAQQTRKATQIVKRAAADLAPLDADKAELLRARRDAMVIGGYSGHDIIEIDVPEGKGIEGAILGAAHMIHSAVEAKGKEKGGKRS